MVIGYKWTVVDAKEGYRASLAVARDRRVRALDWIGLEYGWPWRGAGAAFFCIIVVTAVDLLRTIQLLRFTEIQSKQQHITHLQDQAPSRHGSSQAYHQRDRASHGRAVCLCIPDSRSHALTMRHSVPGIEAVPHEDNLRYFDVKIHGPSQSPYEGIQS